MTDQTELTGKLQEAHVQFLLGRLQGDGLDASIERELAALWEWGAGVSLNDILDRELLINTIVRLVADAPFNQELRTIVVKSVITGIQSEFNDGTTIQNLVPKQEYDKAVAHFAQFEKLRMDVIRMVLESPIYSELITDVLYHGIKDYITTENVVVKKVPGVGALMKAGAKSLNKAIPSLESAAEGTIKKFIAGNLRSSVELSEKILNNALSEGNIRTIADHFWKTVSEKDFAKFKHYVTEEDIDASVAIGDDLWNEVRKAEYLHNMIRGIVNHILDENGDKTLADLVNEIGYTQAYVTDELKQILPGALGREALWQLLEARVRANLAEFYASEACAEALA
ncbi:MAG: hypothetical protein VYA55_02735 [Pseudomonadota bacterium]|nr:hypothetical protein [Pseudomonadota bacterium]